MAPRKAGVLTDKQQRFVAEYAKDSNGTQAAIRAGYAPHAANRRAYYLLREPLIKAAVAAQASVNLARADLTAARVLEELRRVALSDVRTLFDVVGDLKPLHTLTAEQAACIGGLEVIIKNAKAGDGVTDTIHKIKIWDKTKALELLAKHFALLTERIEHGGEVVMRWKGKTE